MVHTCPFEDETTHEPLDMDPEVKQALEGGFCPLCLHDFISEQTCVECGHAFEVDNSVEPPVVLVVPLED